MNASTTEHRGIEIRYGYDMATDTFRAHFDLPEDRRRAVGFQRVVRQDLARPIAPGKHHVDASSANEVIASAKAEIDSYLGSEESA